MSDARLRVVFLGLSISSGYSQGHAATYRALLRAMADRGHRLTFLEREQPAHAASRDLPSAPYASIELYRDLEELRFRFRSTLREADVVVVGSRLPDGVAVARWVLDVAEGPTAFYDLDTPDTLDGLERGSCDYLTAALVPRFSLYLSVTGGPTMGLLQRAYGARNVASLPYGVDPRVHFPETSSPRYDLGLLANHRADRQARLQALLIEPARQHPDGRFIVAGSGYPAQPGWPANVVHREHLASAEHGRFFAQLRFALNVTRRQMQRRGHSPGPRLFEAAACGVPVITDRWPGLETFFVPEQEVVVVQHAQEVVRLLREMPDKQRHQLAERGRRRVLADHSAARRAELLEGLLRETLEQRARARHRPAAAMRHGSAARVAEASLGASSAGHVTRQPLPHASAGQAIDGLEERRPHAAGHGRRHPPPRPQVPEGSPDHGRPLG
jgi:spore maturation protein CgeB